LQLDVICRKCHVLDGESASLVCASATVDPLTIVARVVVCAVIGNRVIARARSGAVIRTGERSDLCVHRLRDWIHLCDCDWNRQAASTEGGGPPHFTGNSARLLALVPPNGAEGGMGVGNGHFCCHEPCTTPVRTPLKTIPACVATKL